MKTYQFFAVFVSLVLSLCLVMPAQATIKVGIVDLLKALNESEQGKKSISEIEAMRKSKQSVIEEKGKRIEQLKSDLEKQASVLSADAKKSKEDEIERLIREFQRLVSDSTNELQKKQREIEVEMIKELKVIIENIGKEEKFTYIVESSEGGLLYFDKAVDITDTVIKKFNESKKSK
ncbi:MAG: OmpH family outer membrane protein [Thermodesulfovibrionales bacterium]|nr:OmpH family outer membrane protein [Thermodesulfovibrionales bacterium]